MRTKIMYWVGLGACVLLIAACYMPWVHYNSINETFTGFHVKKFDTGNYYGKAGYPICIFSFIILILMLVPKVWAKRTGLFFSALLIAYTIRTYIIFTGSLFEGEIEKYPAIYLVLVLPFLILIASLFPKTEIKNDD